MFSRNPHHHHATIDGTAHWELIDAHGNTVQDGAQHNMLLNQGLDLAATYGILGVNINGYTPLPGLAMYCAVGTGSAAPDITQTALGNEVARTLADPGGQTVRGARVAAGVFRSVVVREFDYAAAVGNLTEWGFSPVNSGALAVRELFRDANGNPVVVTKTDQQKLKITYTLTLTIGPTAATASSVNITGLGTRTGQHILMGGTGAATDQTDLNTFEAMVAALSMVGRVLTNDPALTYTNGTDGFMQGTEGTEGAAPAYVPGMYQRAGRAYTWGTAQANVRITNFRVGLPYAYAGWVFKFDAGQELTKSDLYTLSLSGPAVTWGRA